jgi:hypothetical protein
MKFKLSDNVSRRVIQIFQEAMMLGLDGADLLRQVELKVDEVSVSQNPASSDDTATLVLTDDYKQLVKDMHEKYLAEAKVLAAPKGSPDGNN